MSESNRGNADLKYLKNTLRFALYLLNGVLCLILGLGIFVLISILSGARFSLPSSLENLLKEELAKEGVVLQAESIDFDFRANIFIDNATLRFDSTSTDFLRTERLRLGLDFEALRGGIFALDCFYIEDASLSPVDIDASHLSLFSKVFIYAKCNDGTWEVRNSNARLGGLSIYINGDIDNRFLESKDKYEKKLSLEEYIAEWTKLCDALRQVKYYADILNRPSLSVDFDISEKELVNLSVTLELRDATMGLDPYTLKAKHLFFKLDTNSLEGQEGNIFLRTEDFSVADNIFIGGIELFGAVNYEDFERIEELHFCDIDASVFDLSAYGVDIDYLNLKTAQLLLSEIPEQLSVYAKRGDFYLDSKLSIGANTIDIDFDYKDDPFDYLKLPILDVLSEFKLIKELDIKDYAFLRGKGTLYFSEDIRKYQLEAFESLYDIKTTAFLLSEGVYFANKYIEEAYGRVELDLAEGDLYIRDVSISTSEKWTVEGEFFQSLNSNDYFFNARGGFEPSCMNGVMADWWTMVFDKFELIAYPDVEVYVEGEWLNPYFTLAYAKVDVERAKYNDYTFEDISLQLNVNPSIICAYDVKIKGANGYADACLAWIYNPIFGLDGYIERLIKAEVDMAYDGIKALGGEEVAEVMELMEFKDNVYLDFVLRDLNPHRDPDFKQEIDFSFKSENPVKISYFNFDNIEGAGSVKGMDLYLEETNAHFLDGSLQGKFYLENVDKKHYFKTMLNAGNINQGKLLQLIGEITAKEGEEAKDVEAEAFGGIIKSNLNAEGFLLDFNSYKASATLNVENEELKKVSILGGISRLLEAMYIPLTTLEFKTLDGTLGLENGKANFSKLEIKSPTSTLFGKAIYTPMTDEVSARMYFNWKTSSSIPIIGHIVDFAFDPLLDSILIVVSNTLSNPSYSARIRPFNIFNSYEKMIENIDEDSL